MKNVTVIIIGEYIAYMLLYCFSHAFQKYALNQFIQAKTNSPVNTSILCSFMVKNCRLKYKLERQFKEMYQSGFKN